MTTAVSSETPLRLTPRLSTLLRRVLADEDLLRQLAAGFGSPCNLVIPDQLGDNVAAMRAVLAETDVIHRIFLAHKPNRSRAIIRRAATLPLGLDVASEGELANGLTNGFTGDRMEATGPKNPAFLRLALQHGLLINVDNRDELEQLHRMSQALGLLTPAAVVVRLHGLRGERSETKFGVAPREVGSLLRWLTEHRDTVDFRGFSFHLSSATGAERATATEALIEHHVAALHAGLTPSVINVGGGFTVPFLQDPTQGSAYLAAVRRGLLGQSDRLTWNNDGFGLAAEGGRITGTAELSVRQDTPAAQLRAFLQAPLRSQQGRSVARFLAENLAELHLEPGRALFDQAGLTLARVTFVKRSSLGQRVVGLDLNRSQLCTSEREFFLDPVLITGQPTGSRPPDHADGIYFAGNLCLPADMITRHATYLDRVPAPGDLVAFPNTAGYFMDFTESETLLQRTAPKVALRADGEQLRWCRDEDFDPLGWLS